jgi:hypothetical protein
MAEAHPERCIACGRPLARRKKATIRAETPFGALTCHYHLRCFEGASDVERAHDLYRLAAAIQHALNGDRSLSATAEYDLHRPELQPDISPN